MRVKQIVIGHDDIRQLGEIAAEYMGKDYSSISDEMIVIGAETFKLRTSSAQWNMVVLKKKEKHTEIDIIGTAGGAGLLNISWWSESGFTKKLFRHFRNYCEVNSWTIEEVQ